MLYRVLALLALLTGFVIHLDARYVYWGTMMTTNVSGFSSTNHASLDPGSNAFLYGLVFDEKGDKPCYVQGYFWRNTQDRLPSDFTVKFDICSNPPKGDQSLIFSTSQAKQTAINSLRVCNNNDKDHRLKGVQLSAGVIDGDGKGLVIDSGDSKSFDRPNCAIPWKSLEICTAGMAAVGLEIEHSGKEITGLALKCTKPTFGTVAPTDIQTTYTAMENDIQVKTGKSSTKTTNILDAIAMHEVNGVTVVLIDKNAVSIVRHYGLRSKKNNLPTNADTFYDVASMSKFPAAVGMLMASHTSAGPVLIHNLDQEAKGFPKSVIHDWVDKAFKDNQSGFPKDISLRRLLTHTAGLDTHGIGNYDRSNPTEMKNIIMGIRPLQPPGKPVPGTGWEYSGGGYTVAESMLENHSGISAQKFLTENVLKKLGMTKSTYADASDNMTNLARGCSRGSCNDKPPFTNVKFAGGLLAHPLDYARLVITIMKDGIDPDGKRAIDAADVRLMLTPARHKDSSKSTCSGATGCSGSEKCYNSECIRPLDENIRGGWYGLGLFLSKNDDYNAFPRTVSHGGDHDDARTNFWVDRKNQKGILVFVNGMSSWSKNDVSFGAQPLESQITASYWRHF